MIKLHKVTLICVACVRVDRAIKAIKYSCKDINYGSVKLLTHELIEEEGVEVIPIKKLNYHNYNKFIVYNLHEYIDTDFALIIQDDGFVVNPGQWDDIFFNYDYIGAPWPIKPNLFADTNNNIVRVGNGGFSLRSKKLLELPANFHLTWIQSNEDYFISCIIRRILEDNGVIFATIDVAKKFSHETITDETIGITPFGFHGISQEYYYNLI